MKKLTFVTTLSLTVAATAFPPSEIIQKARTSCGFVGYPYHSMGVCYQNKTGSEISGIRLKGKALKNKTIIETSISDQYEPIPNEQYASSMINNHVMDENQITGMIYSLEIDGKTVCPPILVTSEKFDAFMRYDILGDKQSGYTCHLRN